MWLPFSVAPALFQSRLTFLHSELKHKLRLNKGDSDSVSAQSCADAAQDSAIRCM